MRRDCLLKNAMDGTINGKRRRGRNAFQLTDEIKTKGRHDLTERYARDRKE